MDADGPHRFRNGPFGRDVVKAPGGASDLSHGVTRWAAFPGQNTSPGNYLSDGLMVQPAAVTASSARWRSSVFSQSIRELTSQRHDCHCGKGRRPMLFDRLIVSCWTQNGDYSMTLATQCFQHRLRSAIHRSDRLPNRPAFHARGCSHRGSL